MLMRLFQSTCLSFVCLIFKQHEKKLMLNYLMKDKLCHKNKNVLKGIFVQIILVKRLNFGQKIYI